jgi:hypothetical protein
MRTIAAGDATLLASGAYDIQARVWIKDSAGTYQNYESWAVEAIVSDDVDQPTATLSATLALRDAPTASLSPLMGATNLDVGRGVKLEVGYASVGGSVLNWLNVFEGAIDRYSYPDDATLKIEGRDLAGALMDARIENPSTYGSTVGIPMESVMQSILTDWGGGVALYAPTSPAYLINTYKIEDARTVWEALQQLADLIGWSVRYRWDSATAQWRLTLYAPRRSISTPDYTFATDVYHEGGSLIVDRDSVRNAIQVVYGKGSGRTSTTSTDAASISKYGRRFMRLAQDDNNSPIDTLTEAQALANACLADLREPKAELQQSVDLFPWAELGDYYRFSADGVRFSSNQDLAVATLEHRIRSDLDSYEALTTFRLRGTPVAAFYRWHEKTDPVTPPANGTLPDTPTALTATFTGKDAILTWNAPETPLRLSYQVTVLSGATVLRTEVVPDTRYVYTWENNLKDGGPRASLNFEVRSRNAVGNLGPAATTSATNAPPSAPASVTLTGQPLYFLASVPEPTFADYLRTEWQADDNSGFSSPTAAAAGPDWQGVRIGLEAGSGPTYVRARFVDAFNQVSGWTTANSNGVLVGGSYIAAGAVDVAKFASNIRPVGIGSSLPANPYTGYVEGDLFMLVSGGAETMYRLTNPAGTGTSGWSPAINTNDLANNAVTASKILAGAVTAGKIAAGAVSTTELAAKAATIDKLAIADWSNIISNTLADGTSAAGWTGINLVVDAGSGYNYAAEQPDRDAYFRFAYADAIPCEAGKYYYAGCRCVNAGASSYGFTVGVMFYNNAGNVITWISAASVGAATSVWTDIGGIVQAPPNAARMAFWTQIAKTAGVETSKAWRYCNPVLRRASNGELIVDGTITANKIQALDLSAIQGTFGGGVNKSAIDNRGLRVYDSSSTLRTAVGNIGGLAWGSFTIPEGTYGFWGDTDYLYLRNYLRNAGDDSDLIIGAFATSNLNTGWHYVYKKSGTGNAVAEVYMDGAWRNFATVGTSLLLVGGFQTLVRLRETAGASVTLRYRSCGAVS